MKQDNMYKGKRVLSIGASKKVLSKLSKTLEEAGFITQWTNNYNNPEQVIKKFNARDFDVIAFGRGVSKENKKIFKGQFKTQNPAISFMDGLAPITNLLIDQIKLALKPVESPKLSVVFTTSENLTISTDDSIYLIGKLYRLNWLYQARENIIFNEHFDKNSKTYPIPKQRGERFLVIKQKDIVVDIINLLKKNKENYDRQQR